MAYYATYYTTWSSNSLKGPETVKPMSISRRNPRTYQDNSPLALYDMLLIADLNELSKITFFLDPYTFSSLFNNPGPTPHTWESAASTKPSSKAIFMIRLRYGSGKTWLWSQGFGGVRRWGGADKISPNLKNPRPSYSYKEVFVTQSPYQTKSHMGLVEVE